MLVFCRKNTGKCGIFFIRGFVILTITGALTLLYIRDYRQYLIIRIELNNNLIHVSLCNKRQQISKNKCENEEDLEDVSPSQTVQSRSEHIAWNNIPFKCQNLSLGRNLPHLHQDYQVFSIHCLKLSFNIVFKNPSSHLLPPPKLSSLLRMLPRIIFDRMCCYPVYAVTSTKTINSPQDVAWNEVPLNPAAQGKAVSCLILDCPGL